MIAVVAARSDAGARALVQRWPRRAAALLTTRDLATNGWRVDDGDPDRSSVVVGGERIAQSQLRGVVTRLPAVTASELPMIAAQDRTYAATEMTAFLSYWLSSLTCPVLNRPGPAGLCAPGWRTEQWVLTAHRLGIPVRAVHRDVGVFSAGAETRDITGEPSAAADLREADDTGAVGEAVRVTVVGEQCLGADDESMRRHARALAAAADVAMLSVLFEDTGSSVRFVDAHPWADGHDLQVAAAIFDFFDPGAGDKR